MQFLDQFITQTGKHPADWTEQDIQLFLNYVKTHTAELFMNYKDA